MTKACITTIQICPLNRLCAPCHSGRDSKINGPGAMDPIQQRSIAQLCTRCSPTSSTGWQIHRWKPSLLIFPARSDYKVTYLFSYLLQSQAFSTVFPLICGRASEEVRKSISVDLMSSLSRNQKIDLLVDSDEEEVTLF